MNKQTDWQTNSRVKTDKHTTEKNRWIDRQIDRQTDGQNERKAHVTMNKSERTEGGKFKFRKNRKSE